MQVETIIKKHTNRLPVRISAIARELDIAVRKCKMDPGMAGMLFSRGMSCTIGVNRYLPIKLQRYVVAHECAHFVLHRPFLQASPYHWIRDDINFRSPFIPLEVEEEAHRWAMEVLIPCPLLETELKEVGLVDEKTITELADRFGVATGRLKNRLIRMGAAGRIST